MNLTTAQHDAITAHDGNLLVAASAGSGKTEVLARRVAGLIADPAAPLAVDRLLVVTFTKAAAAELRSRVARMLREAAAASDSAALRRHMARQEAALPAADIGTIDAWCGRVLRGEYARSGVDLRYTILDPAAARALRRRVLGELLDEMHGARSGPLAEARAWLHSAARPSVEFLGEMVEQLNRYREHVADVEQWRARVAARAADPRPEMPVAERLVAECSRQVDELTSIAPGRDEREAELLAAYALQLRSWLDALEPLLRGAATEAADRAALSGAVQRVIKEIGGSAFAGLKRLPGELERARRIREEWFNKRLKEIWGADCLTSIFEHAALAAALLRVVLDLEQRYHDALSSAKRAAATYEFADVVRMTLDVLRGGGPGEDGAAARLRARYEHVLVDECQDLSAVQFELIECVRRRGPRGNLFLVGDVKQSIYGFRQADPRALVRLRRAYEAHGGDGRVIYLSDNFRSLPAVLAPLNELFAGLFDERLGGTAFRDAERLRAARTDLDTAPRVELHIVESDRDDSADHDDGRDNPLAPEPIEREAQAAAEAIRGLLSSGATVHESSRDGAARTRPLRPADIVILMRAAHVKAGQVARVLRDNGLRAAAAGGQPLLDAVEVQDLVQVLRLLVNRRQDLALAAYLRGPTVGLEVDALVRIRELGGSGEFLDAVRRARAAAASSHDPADRVLAARLAQADEQLDRWAQAAVEEDVAALLRRIDRESGAALFAGGLRGAEARLERVAAMHRLAATLGAGGGVAEFVDRLDALAEADAEPRGSSVTDDDVIRIMTVHSAKGLEFPVVLALGCGTRFRCGGADGRALAVDDAHGAGVRWFDCRVREWVESGEFGAIRESVKRRELEEELRLLYVCTTRARDRLMMIGTAQARVVDDWIARRPSGAPGGGIIDRLQAGSWLEWMLPVFAARGLFAERSGGVRLVRGSAAGLSPRDPPLEAPAPEPPSPWTAEDDAWLAGCMRRLTAPASAGLSRLPAAISVSAIKRSAREQTGGDEPPIDVARAEAALPALLLGGAGAADGRVAGSAMHRFLERCDLADLGDRAAIVRQRDDMITRGALSAELAALVDVEQLLWFGSSGLGRLLAKAGPRVRRESPFVCALPLGDTGEHAIVRGVIDALAPTDDGWLVVDYKTDRVADDAVLARRLLGYTIQVQIYGEAAGRILGQPIAGGRLVMLTARRVLDVPAAAAPAAELIGSLVARGAAGS